MASFGVWVLATVGLLSAASRPLRGRLEPLLRVVPFLVPRTAALTLVFVSFALLLTARGLRRGHYLAWLAAEALLLVSVVLNVAKGIDVEEAVLATGCAVWLALHRDAFPVWTSRAHATRSLVLAVGGGGDLRGSDRVVADHRESPPKRRRGIPAFDRGADRGGRGLPLKLGGQFGTAILVALELGMLGSTLWVLFSARELAPLDNAAHHGDRER